MSKTKVKVKLFLVSSDKRFEPEYVTKLLKVAPSEIRHTGDVTMTTRIGKKFYAKENSWMIETDYVESYYCIQQINEILLKIKGKEEALRKLYNDHEIDINLMIIIEIENDIFPVIDFSPELLQYLASINCGVQFDQYYMSGVEDKSDDF